MEYINTIKYGYLLIRYDKAYTNDTIDTIEDCQGNFYEIRTNLNGKLIALEVKG